MIDAVFAPEIIQWRLRVNTWPFTLSAAKCCSKCAKAKLAPTVAGSIARPRKAANLFDRSAYGNKLQ